MALTKPAELLEGLTLDSGWIVQRRVEPSPDATGGMFSVSYLVSGQDGSNEQQAFLKALDFSSASEMHMPFVDALQYLTKAYTFERDLVMRCAGQKMSNVVRGIDHGQVAIDPSTVSVELSGELLIVPYIIFEVANGDVRSAVAENSGSFDLAWKLRVLHGVSNGLRQLHQAGIYHQDLKASNIMTFDHTSKVGDLGRSSVSGVEGLFDDIPFAGDRTYAPPELLYEETNPDEALRRRASDCYQLGSLLVYLLSGSGLTPLIAAEMPSEFHWREWVGDYRRVLPYVRDAFGRVLQNLEGGGRPVDGELLGLIRSLSDPDPQLRGHKQRNGVQRLSMERYVSAFDRLAKSVEAQIRAGQA